MREPNLNVSDSFDLILLFLLSQSRQSPPFLAHVPKMLHVVPNFRKVVNFPKVFSALGT